MKRAFFIIIGLYLVCVQIFAQKVTIDKITYEIEKEEAFVYGADPDIEVANILSSVEYKGKSYPVTRIGKKFRVTPKLISGFSKCSKLKTVSIPNSVKAFGTIAFALCESLEELSIPNSVRSFGVWCFAGTPLKKITVPDSPVEMRKDYPAFLGASPSLTSRKELHKSCNLITEVKCQNGSFPLWIIPYLPEECPFVLSQKYQLGGNSNMYAQNVQPQPVQTVPQQTTKQPSSDVDVNIPQGASGNENTFAVIFANENYQEEEKVDYALNDGEIFRTYCQKVLGLPEDNIHIRKDATLNNIKAEMSWLQKVAEAYKGQARFIIYYAGHGIPDEKTGTAYLLPVDGNGSMLETGYSLKQFYTHLGEMPSAGITVFMDACFSGSKRGEGMLASARGVAIKAKPQAPQGKMVVFSAALGDETAYPFKEKEHGLFTYYLLKKLKETGGNVSLGELGQFITDQVSRKSIVVNSKSQTPCITASPALQNTWRNLKLK